MVLGQRSADQITGQGLHSRPKRLTQNIWCRARLVTESDGSRSRNKTNLSLRYWQIMWAQFKSQLLYFQSSSLWTCLAKQWRVVQAFVLLPHMVDLEEALGSGLWTGLICIKEPIWGSEPADRSPLPQSRPITLHFKYNLYFFFKSIKNLRQISLKLNITRKLTSRKIFPTQARLNTKQSKRLTSWLNLILPAHHCRQIIPYEASELRTNKNQEP